MGEKRSIQIARRAAWLTFLGAAAFLLGIGTIYAAGKRTTRVKQHLAATSVAPGSRGKARFKIRSSENGKFKVAVAKLEGDKTYDVIVGGVKVGELHTSRGGRGRASFSTRPNTRNALLGFDPRGRQMSVRDQEDGEDVLVGDLPDDDPNAIACCLAEEGDDEGEVECEDINEADCLAAGGTPVGVPAGTVGVSCLPNPCADTSPVGEEIVCCTNETHDDESEAECEDVATAGACADLGGTIVSAASCDPNPCQATPPANAAACCVPDGDGSETECEVISAEACDALLGTPAGTASCSSDPCGGGSSDDSGV